MVNKNDEFRLKITGYTSEGGGVGKFDGQAIFVENTAVGDEILCHIIKAKKTYAVGKAVKIIKPAKCRIEPECDAFKMCGGCSFAHIKYEEELKSKDQKVKDAFSRIGGHTPKFAPIIPSPDVSRYRNKAQYPVKRENGVLNIGFYAKKSHRVIDGGDCLLQPAEFTEIIEIFRKWIHDNNVTVYSETTQKGLLRHIYLRKAFATGEIMVCAVINGKTLPESIEYLRETAESVGLNDLIYGVDEGRILEGNSSGNVGSELLTRTCGYTYQAAYDARLTAQMFNNDIAYFSAWSYLSNGFLQGNPTVSYHVAKNAAKFGGANLVSTDKTKSGVILGSDVDAVSAFNEKTNTLHVMAYNFKNDVEYDKSTEMTFEINAPQFSGKNVKVTAYVINDDCNYFDEWVEDRKTYNITDDCFAWSPDDPSIDNPTTLVDEDAREIYFSELYSKYTECSKLVPTETEMVAKDGKITLDITLDPHAVVFYEITTK